MLRWQFVWRGLMLRKRIIARLDCKPPHLVKGIQMEGLRVMGDPAEFSARYYKQGADELFYQDTRATLFGMNGLADLVKRTSESVFVPMTVGGGIRSVDDVRTMLMAGADKTAINTAAIARPLLISEVAKAFGSQCMVVSIEYADGQALTDNGRESTGLDAYDWARKAVDYGAGELVLTSIHRDGMRTGYDLDFINRIAGAVSVPVVAHGGAGSPAHMGEAAVAGADGMAVASILHYGQFTISQLKEGIHDHALRTA